MKLIGNDKETTLIRNKRRGLRLKVRINLDSGICCAHCFFTPDFSNNPVCILCKDYERITRTKRFWFEKR